SVTYFAPLDLFVMASWGTGQTADGTWFGGPSYLGFWVASNPWGSWTQVHEETNWLPGGDRAARASMPKIAPRWVAEDGRSFWLVWWDYQTPIASEDELREQYFAAVAEAEARATSPDELEAEMTELWSRFRPRYSFQTQRVELST